MFCEENMSSEKLLLKLQDRSLLVIILRDIAGQRSQAITSSLPSSRHGQGGAALHPPQGVAGVGFRPGEGLVEWTGVPLIQCTSHRATCELQIVASRFSQHQPDQS